MLIQVQLEASSICHFDEREIASYFSRKTTQTPNTLMRFLVAMLCRNDNARHPELVSASHPAWRMSEIYLMRR